MLEMQLFTPREILTVSQFLDRVKRNLESEFDFVWVEGEITGLRRPGSGHLYFGLKDRDGLVRAVMFRQQASLVRFKPEEGKKVLCRGRLTVYPPRGDMQLVVDSLESRGAGSLALAFEELKARLAAEGLFDPDRKKPLPDLPRRVAVITSPTGAAIRDFLKVLKRRDSRVQVAVYPTQVQGDQAAGQMVEALADLAAWGWPEVIVLTRGGGSPEDLWAYNDEKLARAIAACPLPVVSAVGHEVDFSIADFVADLRAPTPSAAAEMLVRNRAELSRRLEALARRLGLAGRRALRDRRTRLDHLVKSLGDPRRALAQRRLRIDDLLQRARQAERIRLGRARGRLGEGRSRLLADHPGRRLARLEARREHLAHRLAEAGKKATAGRRSALETLGQRLRALSPLGVLGRGYSLTTDARGNILRDASELKPGDRLNSRLAKGTVLSRVEKTFD